MTKIYETINVFILSLLFLGLLSGCGFKLRGAYKLPLQMSTTYVEASQANNTLSRTLIRFLKASDINVVSAATANAATLKLFKAKRNKRIVSLDAKGRAREYTLISAISFQVTSSGEFEVEEQEVKIERDFVFDTEDVLGNSRQESQLYEEMQLDLIRMILLRLQSRA